MASMAPDELLTVGELAVRLGESPSNLKYWESQGIIPTATRIARPGGDAYRVWRASEVAGIAAAIAGRTTSKRGAAA